MQKIVILSKRSASKELHTIVPACRFGSAQILRLALLAQDDMREGRVKTLPYE